HLNDAAAIDLVWRLAGELLAVEADRAGPGPHESAHRIEHGGLAAPVGAEECDDLSLRNGKAHAEQNLLVGIARFEVPYVDDRQGRPLTHDRDRPPAPSCRRAPPLAARRPPHGRR